VADISDVEQSLLSLLTQTAYPNGTSNPSAVMDAGGAPHNVQLYRGWPVPDQLDVDMAAETVDVSIFPNRVEQNVTRYGLDYEELLPFPTPTLTLIAGATTLTVGGTVSVPQNVAALVNGFGYSYGVQSNDTLASIATGLAALINVNTAATSSGPVITIPTARKLTPRIGVVGNVIQEVARQKRNVVIGLWCPSPDLRDNAAKLFDPILKSRNFLNMPDGTKCRLIYVSSPVTDTIEKQAVYRRDLIYSCEYGTTITTPAPIVTIEQINILGGIAPSGVLELETGGDLLLEDGSNIELEPQPVIETIYL
jgi:hypothetical protein